MAANRVRGLFSLAVLVLALGCGNSRNITRVTITVDTSALTAEMLAAVKTIRLHVTGDRQVVDNDYPVPPGLSLIHI